MTMREETEKEYTIFIILIFLKFIIDEKKKKKKTWHMDRKLHTKLIHYLALYYALSLLHSLTFFLHVSNCLSSHFNSGIFP